MSLLNKLFISTTHLLSFIWFFFGVFISSSFGIESSPTQKVNSKPLMDLGEVSVKGELRKSSVIRFDSQKPMRELLPLYLKSEWDRFETYLLEPTEIESTQILESLKPSSKSDKSHAKE